MSLSLLIHRPEGSAETVEEARAALRDAVWEVAEAHWSLGGDAVLVSSDLSPDYLLDHFRRALSRRGVPSPGLLMVASVGPRAAWTGLPPEAATWLREALDSG
jgi:hypothetical protein